MRDNRHLLPQTFKNSWEYNHAPDRAKVINEFLQDQEETIKHYQKEVGEAVVHARLLSGFSQAVLSREMNTSRSNIARIECGDQNVTIAYLARIAARMGLSLKIEFIDD